MPEFTLQAGSTVETTVRITSPGLGEKLAGRIANAVARSGGATLVSIGRSISDAAEPPAGVVRYSLAEEDAAGTPLAVLPRQMLVLDTRRFPWTNADADGGETDGMLRIATCPTSARPDDWSLEVVRSARQLRRSTLGPHTWATALEGDHVELWHPPTHATLPLLVVHVIRGVDLMFGGSPIGDELPFTEIADPELFRIQTELAWDYQAALRANDRKRMRTPLLRALLLLGDGHSMRSVKDAVDVTRTTVFQAPRGAARRDALLAAHRANLTKPDTSWVDRGFDQYEGLFSAASILAPTDYEAYLEDEITLKTLYVRITEALFDHKVLTSEDVDAVIHGRGDR